MRDIMSRSLAFAFSLILRLVCAQLSGPACGSDCVNAVYNPNIYDDICICCTQVCICQCIASCSSDDQEQWSQIIQNSCNQKLYCPMSSSTCVGGCDSWGTCPAVSSSTTTSTTTTTPLYVPPITTTTPLYVPPTTTTTPLYVPPTTTTTTTPAYVPTDTTTSQETTNDINTVSTISTTPSTFSTSTTTNDSATPFFITGASPDGFTAADGSDILSYMRTHIPPDVSSSASYACFVNAPYSYYETPSWYSTLPTQVQSYYSSINQGVTAACTLSPSQVAQLDANSQQTVSQADKHHALSGGAIGGIVAGAVVIAAIAGFLVHHFWFKSPSKSSVSAPHAPPMGSAPPSMGHPPGHAPSGSSAPSHPAGIGPIGHGPPAYNPPHTSAPSQSGPWQVHPGSGPSPVPGYVSNIPPNPNTGLGSGGAANANTGLGSDAANNANMGLGSSASQPGWNGVAGSGSSGWNGVAGSGAAPPSGSGHAEFIPVVAGAYRRDKKPPQVQTTNVNESRISPTHSPAPSAEPGTTAATAPWVGYSNESTWNEMPAEYYQNFDQQQRQSPRPAYNSSSSRQSISRRPVPSPSQGTPSGNNVYRPSSGMSYDSASRYSYHGGASPIHESGNRTLYESGSNTIHESGNRSVYESGGRD